jgi:hypothetical protein
VRNYSGSLADVLYFPLSPAFDLCIYQVLRFSTSSLSLYYFLLHEALHFRAGTRRPMKCTKAQTGAAEYCWAKRLALGEVHSADQTFDKICMKRRTF